MCPSTGPFQPERTGTNEKEDKGGDAQGTENPPTSAVKLERRLQRNLLARRRRLGVRLFGRVQTVDVGLVMSRMVQLHDLLRNMGFECLSRVHVCASVVPLVSNHPE